MVAEDVNTKGHHKSTMQHKCNCCGHYIFVDESYDPYPVFGWQEDSMVRVIE